jgi:hypothetical protein
MKKTFYLLLLTMAFLSLPWMAYAQGTLYLHVELEQQHVAVFHDVFLAFHPVKPFSRAAATEPHFTKSS